MVVLEKEDLIRGRVRLRNKNQPDGYEKFTCSREQYELLSRVILEILEREGEISLKDVLNEIHERLHHDSMFRSGRTRFLTRSVKTDLEARGLLVRIPGSKPQRITLAASEPHESHEE